MKSSNIGGQAVMEGVMMMNKDRYSVAVRRPDGEIEVKVEQHKPLTKHKGLLKVPILRGVFSFADSMIVGMSSLMYSASFYEDEEEDEDSDGGLGLADEADGESIVEDNPVNGLLKAIGGLAEDLSGLMSGKGVKPAQTNPSASDRRTEIPQAVEQPEIFRIYAFKNLDQVILSAKLVKGIYDSENSLYKNPRDSRFYLYMTKDKNTDNEFVKTCNLLGEYSNRVRATYATPSHMREHYKLIIDANALQTLAKL